MSCPPPQSALPLLAALLGFVAGCASRGNVDLLEARLRDEQDRRARLEREIQQAQEEVRISRQDADNLRSQLVGRGETVILPEQADALFRARKLQINQLLTAGVDTDGRPGDDALTTVVAPIDAGSRPIRLPGQLELVLREQAPEDGPPGRMLKQWTFTPEESRSLWQRDVLAGGFRLQLPLDGEVTAERVELSARLKTADGRRLEAKHRFELRLDGGVPEPVPLADEEPAGLFEVEPVSARVDAVPEPNDDLEPNPFDPDEFAPEVEDAKAARTAAKKKIGRPAIDGVDEANGNGLDRTRPARTSDRFRFEDGNIRRYQ